MYCNKCGTENSDDAVFCKKCGSAVEAEEETRVAQRVRNDAAVQHTSDDSPLIFAINPTLKFVTLGYVMGVVAVFVLVVILTEFVL